MKIVFDPTTLHQSKSGAVTGVVYFDFDVDRQFPSDDWSDFVVVVTGWWLDALKQLERGEMTVTLRFMDGPYAITALARGPNLVLRCVEDRSGARVLYELVGSMVEIRRELMALARQLLNACAQAEIRSPDLDHIKKYLPN